MTTTVEIRPGDVRVALTRAKDRNESFKERESYLNRLEQGDRHPEVDNLVGVIGELAFSTYSGIPMDPDIYETGDSGIDFHAQIGDEQLTIDMKTRSTDPSYFWVKEYALDADYYVLGHLHEPIDLDSLDIEDIETLEGWEVELIGGARREEFLEARKVDSDLGHVNRSILIEDLDPLPKPNEIKQVDTSQGW